MLKNKHKTDDNFEILLQATYKNTKYDSKNHIIWMHMFKQTNNNYTYK